MFVVITGGISATLHVKLIISTFFGIITGNISFALLADNITDNAFLTLEIIPDSIRFIRSLSIFKNRSTLGYTQRIFYTMSIHCTTIHIHGNDISSQFYLLIINLTLPV